MKPQKAGDRPFFLRYVDLSKAPGKVITETHPSFRHAHEEAILRATDVRKKYGSITVCAAEKK